MQFLKAVWLSLSCGIVYSQQSLASSEQEMFSSKSVLYAEAQLWYAYIRESSKYWVNRGITGKYNVLDLRLAEKQLSKGRCDVESLLGFCRLHFVFEQSDDRWIPRINNSGLSPCFKDIRAKVVKRVKKDVTGLSDNESMLLSLFVCADVDASELVTALQNWRGKDCTLEDAFFLLHLHPVYPWYKTFFEKLPDLYTKAIALSLDKVVSVFKSTQNKCDGQDDREVIRRKRQIVGMEADALNNDMVPLLGDSREVLWGAVTEYFETIERFKDFP